MNIGLYVLYRAVVVNKWDFEYPVIDKRKTGDTLKRYMQERGLTDRDVQEYLGLACVQTVYRWTTGISIPTIDNLYALSRLMKVSIDDLICCSKH